MPTKASLTLRSVKGSPILTSEMDANFTALRDQSIGIADDTSTVLDLDSGNTLTIAGAGTVSTAISGSTITITGSAGAVSPITFVGDDSTGTAVNVGETFKIAGAQNITTAVTGDTLTVTGPDLTSYITASSSDTLTNKTIDANGTGNSITNLEVADFAGSAVITVAETLAANDSDTAVVTAGAIIDYVDAETANIASDSLTFTNKTFDANGTGNSITNIEVADLASGVLDTDLSTVSASDDTLASAKAIKAYADTKGTLNNISEDTTPQLGGNLDVNGNSIVSVSNGNIVLAADGTGAIKIDDANSALDYNNYGAGSLIIEDTTSGANIGMQHYVTGPAVGGTGDNIQYIGFNYDTSGTYSNPDSSSFNGDYNVLFAFDFTNQEQTWFGDGGALNIDTSGTNGDGYAKQPIKLKGSNVVFVSPYDETVTALTSSSTIAVDCSASSVSRVALGTNTQFTFNNLPAGRSHTLIIVSSGSYTATFDDSTSTAVKFPGGAPTITASGTDVVTVFNTGTEILGNIAQDFQ